MEQQGTGQQAGADSCDGTLSFETIFEKELEVVAFRRAEIKKG